jgi:hypothetical protein
MVKINDFGLNFAKSGAIASPFVAEYWHPASDWYAFVITNEHLVTNFAEGCPDELRGYLVAHRVCLVGVHQSPDVLRMGLPVTIWRSGLRPSRAGRHFCRPAPRA